VSERVQITRNMVGLCYMQVCAVEDATDHEILDVCNRRNPSGTTMGWTRVVREAADKSAPITCEDEPNRTHFLVAC